MNNSLAHTRRIGAGWFASLASAGIATVTVLACAPQPVAQGTAGPMQSPVAAQTNALPVAVNCGPGQQVLIRPSLVNGQQVSQVDCVATGAPAGSLAQSFAPASLGSTPVAYQVAGPQSIAPAGDMETMRVVERPVYRQAAGQSSERRAIQTGRRWQKSALIIGSSAGIGAGVGGAAGGKKGALIGAALGGGGATIWDQITRR